MSRNWTFNLIFISVFLFSICSFSKAQVSFPHPSPHRPFGSARQGICYLEVPTVQLLSENDRLGPIPVGNGSNPQLSKIEVCCSGWTRKLHNHYECEPICDKGCDNGNCTAPNICTCKKGYIKDAKDKCVPTCPIGCANGVCTNNGYCSCNSGFESSRDGKYCVPICRNGCGIGGECIGGDQCHCLEGFSLNPLTHKCEYHCEGGCRGGTCIGPNQCSCPQGFQRLNNSCVASCPRGCVNGDCVGPNICQCKPGWLADGAGASCEPQCAEPCLNADCVAPNVCACKKGYVKDSRALAGNRCIADCPGGCPNGQCSAPNFCICNPGFVKERKGSSNCIRRVRRSIHYELIPPQFLK